MEDGAAVLRLVCRVSLGGKEHGDDVVALGCAEGSRPELGRDREEERRGEEKSGVERLIVRELNQQYAD